MYWPRPRHQPGVFAQPMLMGCFRRHATAPSRAQNATVALVFSGDRSPQTGATAANNSTSVSNPLRRHQSAEFGRTQPPGSLRRLRQMAARPTPSGNYDEKIHFIPFHFVPLSLLRMEARAP